MTDLEQLEMPPRRREVVRLAADGWPQEYIGEELDIRQQTVSRHVSAAVRQYPKLADLLWRERRGRPRKSA